MLVLAGVGTIITIPRFLETNMLQIVGFLLLLSYVSGLKFPGSDANIIYQGRFNADGAADWPAAAVKFNVVSLNQSAFVEVEFDGCTENCKFFVDSVVDCEVVQNTEVSAASPSVNLKLDTIVGEPYEIRFRKVTESCNGDAHGNFKIKTVNLNGLEFSSKLSASKYHNCLTRHKMLVIGDSITAAYGVDGASPCSYSAATENVDHSYASIVAKEVQADLQVVAWSGMGVVRNYGDANQVSDSPMPDYYNRTIATVPVSSSAADPNYWSPAAFPADIVLVMLGTNDYSTQPQPSDAQFVSGLVALLDRISADYPGARGRTAAMCAPMQAGPQCANIQRGAQLAGVNYVFIDPDTLSGGYGCDGHPNAATQQNIADVVTPAVKSMLGRVIIWGYPLVL